MTSITLMICSEYLPDRTGDLGERMIMPCWSLGGSITHTEKADDHVMRLLWFPSLEAARVFHERMQLGDPGDWTTDSFEDFIEWHRVTDEEVGRAQAGGEIAPGYNAGLSKLQLHHLIDELRFENDNLRAELAELRGEPPPARTAPAGWGPSH